MTGPARPRTAASCSSAHRSAAEAGREGATARQVGQHRAGRQPSAGEVGGGGGGGGGCGGGGGAVGHRLLRARLVGEGLVAKVLAVPLERAERAELHLARAALVDVEFIHLRRAEPAGECARDVARQRGGARHVHVDAAGVVHVEDLARSLLVNRVLADAARDGNTTNGRRHSEGSDVLRPEARLAPRRPYVLDSHVSAQADAERHGHSQKLAASLQSCAVDVFDGCCC